MKNKTVKRILATALVGTMALGLVACGEKKEEKPNTDKENVAGDEVSVDDTETTEESVTLSEVEQILVDVYDLSPMDFPVMTWAINVDDADQVKSYAGLNNGEKLASLAVSEPAMSGQAYSAIVAEVKNVADAQQVADEMKAGINNAKWGEDVVADDVCVKVESKFVCLVMISSEYKETATAEALVDLAVKVITGEAVAPEKEVVEGDAQEMVEDALAAETEEPTEDVEAEDVAENTAE